MKTRKGWDKSGHDLKDYLNVGDFIDEALFMYLAEAVVPQYCHGGIVQLGEAERHDGNCIGYFMTAIHINDKYIYLGILPEFVKPK